MKLNAITDGLPPEDGNSAGANDLVASDDNRDGPRAHKLVEVLMSPDIERFIAQKYQVAVRPPV
jgi:ABC-type metal ion transport system substrate-binding protein